MAPADWSWRDLIRGSRFDFPGGSDGKVSAYNAGDPGSISGSCREDCLEKQMASTVFLPGDFHGQRSLVGYSLLGCKEMDMTE